MGASASIDKEQVDPSKAALLDGKAVGGSISSTPGLLTSAPAGTTKPRLHRLRRMLYIKAYNAKPDGWTIEELFLKHATRNAAGELVLTRDGIKSAVKLSAPWFDELLKSYACSDVEEVALATFVDFLASGNTNLSSSNNSVMSASSSAASLLGSTNKLPPLPSSPSKCNVLAPPPPSQAPSSPQHQYYDAASKADGSTADGNVARDDGSASLLFDAASQYSGSHPTLLAPLFAQQQQQPQDKAKISAQQAHNVDLASRSRPPLAPTRAPAPTDALVKHKGTGLTVAGDCFRVKRGPQKPLWRKREVMLQERIVQYTTVDAEGQVQELVETERSSTEVVHMECKETGEFAHRETSEYEQSELFNNELVAENRGNEEYYHLKSTEDEVEFMESNNMPNRAGGEAGAQQSPGPQPQANGETTPVEAAHEGFAAGQQPAEGSFAEADFRAMYPQPEGMPDEEYEACVEAARAQYEAAARAAYAAAHGASTPTGEADGVWVPHADDGSPQNLPADEAEEEARGRQFGAAHAADDAYFAAAAAAHETTGRSLNDREKSQKSLNDIDLDDDDILPAQASNDPAAAVPQAPAGSGRPPQQRQEEEEEGALSGNAEEAQQQGGPRFGAQDADRGADEDLHAEPLVQEPATTDDEPAAFAS